MKKISSLFLALAAVMTITLFTSCDPEVVTPEVGPEISFVSEAGFLSTDAELQAGESFFVKLDMLAGDSQLKALTVTAGGSNVDFNDFTVNGSGASANPIGLFGTDKDGATYELGFTAPANVGDVVTYTFTLQDDIDKTSAVSLTIVVAAPPTTPLTFSDQVTIVNNIDGPSGVYGSLDLDNMELVPSSSTESELKDKGINLGATSDAENWYQQILPANGATLRVPDASQLENFSYANVDNREAVLAAWDTGVDLAETEKLAIGDVFIINKGDDYYLFEVANINVTPSDNLDYYTFNIKGSRN